MACLPLVLFLACAGNFVSGQTFAQDDVCKAVQGAIYEDIGQKHGVPGHYYLSRGRLNNLDAEEACRAIGGHMVEFETEERFNLVSDCIKDRIINFENIHMGGTVNPTTGVVTSFYTTGKPLFVEWHNGELRKLQGHEVFCAALYRRPGNNGVKSVLTDCSQTIGRVLCEL